MPREGEADLGLAARGCLSRRRDQGAPPISGGARVRAPSSPIVIWEGVCTPDSVAADQREGGCDLGPFPPRVSSETPERVRTAMGSCPVDRKERGRGDWGAPQVRSHRSGKRLGRLPATSSSLETRHPFSSLFSSSDEGCENPRWETDGSVPQEEGELAEMPFDWQKDPRRDNFEEARLSYLHVKEESSVWKEIVTIKVPKSSEVWAPLPHRLFGYQFREHCMFPAAIQQGKVILNSPFRGCWRHDLHTAVPSWMALDALNQGQHIRNRAIPFACAQTIIPLDWLKVWKNQSEYLFKRT